MNQKIFSLESILIIGILIGLIGFSLIQIHSIQNENNLFKTIITSNNEVSEVDLISQKADSFYSEASYNYEDMDYKNLESNCRIARGYYQDASQGYLKIVSELNTIKKQDKLIILQIQSIELLSEINLNLYEACEHFESAARYYDKYYNTDVSQDDSSYDMAGKEIEAMNLKINEHDANVREYNSILTKFQVILKNELK